MAEDSSIRFSIEPLKGEENYAPWSVQIKDLLSEHDLWAYVDGSEPQPTESDAEWKRKDAKALRQIRMRVARDLVILVRDCKTSKEAWDTLNTTYQTTGVIGITTLRRKLYTLLLPEGGDIE